MTDLTDAMIDAAQAAFIEAVDSAAPCPRCSGKGYHHGFGEYGHDPDWCEVCGGPGFVPGHTERDAMRLAIEAALKARMSHTDSNRD